MRPNKVGASVAGEFGVVVHGGDFHAVDADKPQIVYHYAYSPDLNFV